MTHGIRDAACDRAGGYKVDVSRGERIRSRVLRMILAARRALPCPTSMPPWTERSRTRAIESAAIRVEASRDDAERLRLMLPGSDALIAPTPWSFGQVAGLAGAPAAYLR